MSARRIVAAAALLLAAVAGPLGAAAPDFTGTWERYPQPDEKVDPRYAPSAISDPPLKEPWLGEWKKSQAVLQARLAESQPAGEDYVKCLPDGMPSMMMGMFPMEIIQLKDQVNITQEAFNQTRRIYMNQKLPKWDEVDPTFFGTAVGRWEGETLVIETIGVKERVRFRWAPHSEQMKITERISMIGPNMLRDEIKIEDPWLTKPWTYSYVFRKTPGYKLQEYVCEDNREYIDPDGKHRLRIDEAPPAAR